MDNQYASASIDFGSSIHQGNLAEIEQVKVSVFHNKEWQEDSTIADLLASIKSGSCLEGLVDSDQQETVQTLYERYKYRKFKAVFWGGTGTMANLFNAKGLLNYNGLVYLNFAPLSDDRRLFLQNVLRDDPYTIILYTSFLGKPILNWVVRVAAKRFQFKNLVHRVAEYLKQTYGLLPNEIASDSFVQGRLCYITPDPNILFRPEYVPMPLSKQGRAKLTGTLSAVQQIVENQSENSANSLTISTISNRLKSVSPYDNELKTTAVLEAVEVLDKWFLENFVRVTGTDLVANGNRSETELAADPKVQIIIGGKRETGQPRKISITELRQQESSIGAVTFEVNPASGTVVVCTQEESTGKQYKPTLKVATDNIGQCLLDLLAEGELLASVVYEQIAPKVNRKPRTVRAEIAKILSGQLALQTSTGKSVRLAKRRTGNDHFLYLIPVE